MVKALKIRLKPTKEQEILMLKTIGCCRVAYNWALDKCNRRHKQGQKYSMSDVRKEFTQLKKQEDYIWLNEVSNTSMVEVKFCMFITFYKFYATGGQYEINYNFFDIYGDN